MFKKSQTALATHTTQEQNHLFIKVIESWDREALNSLIQDRLVNMQEPFLRNTMLHCCMESIGRRLGTYINNMKDRSQISLDIASDYKIIILLLENGADPNIRNSEDKTAIELLNDSMNFYEVPITGPEIKTCKQYLLDCAVKCKTDSSATIRAHQDIIQKVDGTYLNYQVPASNKYIFFPHAVDGKDEKMIDVLNTLAK